MTAVLVPDEARGRVDPLIHSVQYRPDFDADRTLSTKFGRNLDDSDISLSSSSVRIFVLLRRWDGIQGTECGECLGLHSTGASCGPRDALPWPGAAWMGTATIHDQVIAPQVTRPLGIHQHPPPRSPAPGHGRNGSGSRTSTAPLGFADCSRLGTSSPSRQ